MPRRRELNAVADGVLSSFISRNNDVYGYWGIGKLFSFMLKSNSNKLKIDLLKQTINPEEIEFDLMIEYFANIMWTIIKNCKIDPTYVRNAYINIDVNFEDNSKNIISKLIMNELGCSCTIEDDLGKKHQIEKKIKCSEHSPKFERKSCREYKNLKSNLHSLSMLHRILERWVK
jgi:hypothetical protein